MGTHSVLRGLAVTAVAGSMLAACGSSSSSSSATTAAGATTATSGASAATSGGSTASGTPIVVGNIGSYGGSQAASEGGAQLVINAWADSVNAAGGIGGHPVKLIVKDDANSPTSALADAKELIQTDHVVAIIGDQSNVDQVWAPIAAAAGVPVVGGLSINLPFVSNPDFFASGTNVIAAIYGMLTQAKTAFGPKTAFLYCAESPQCASAVPLYKGLAQATGTQLVYNASVSATAPDYTAVCQALKNSGATSYEIGDASVVVERIAAACATQGVTAKQITTDGTVTESWLKTPALSGVLAAETDAPFSDTSTPAMQAYQAAIAKYAPNLGTGNGPNAFYAWVSGKLFEKAVESGGSGAVTSASVKAGLYTLKGETLGGIAPPLTFTAGRPGQVNCWFTLSIAGGKFTTPNGLTPSCAPDAVIGAVASKL